MSVKIAKTKTAPSERPVSPALVDFARGRIIAELVKINLEKPQEEALA